jgi:hypothetical protein
LPKTKNNLPNFQNQWYIGNFMSHCDQVPTTLNLLHLHIKLSPYVSTVELAWTLSFNCWQIHIFADFSGSAGHKVGGIHFMYHKRTLCPAHEKNAGDLWNGHESIGDVI